MRAMILAAGLGTRLKPFTNTIPKALVPLAGKPMIWHVINKLKHSGIRDFVMNLHHFADDLKDYLTRAEFSDLRISFSDERHQLLDTGGGILHARAFLEDRNPFLVHNCDVISLIPIEQMLAFHNQSKALATLAVSRRHTSRPLAFDKNLLFKGRWNETVGSDYIPMAFSGISVFDPNIFNFMPDAEVFSIIDVLIAAGADSPVIAYEHNPEIWADAGSPESLLKAEKLLKHDIA